MGNRNRGFGLIEILIVAVILLVAMGLYTQYGGDSVDAVGTAQAQIDRANAVADRANSRVGEMDATMELMEPNNRSSATSSNTRR